MIFTGNHTLGRARARTLGYPTINLHEINTVIIENGIYAAWATIKSNKFMAALFVGESPTFKDKEKSIEIFLIGLKENLEPLIRTKITVETIQYIRPVIKFASKVDLIKQITQDVSDITKILSGTT